MKKRAVGKDISVVIPTWNEAGNIEKLIKRAAKSLAKLSNSFELIVVDDHSTDNTPELVKSLSKDYPVILKTKRGQRGKAESLLEGFRAAKGEIIGMIDGDLQYPPEALPSMIKKLKSADIVVANRVENSAPLVRKVASKVFSTIFGKFLHNLDLDIQSGLKVFKRETLAVIKENATKWTFDLEFLVNGRNAGFKIESFNIPFAERKSGESKINLLKASQEIGLSAIKTKFNQTKVFPVTKNSKNQAFYYEGRRYATHNNLNLTESALNRLSTPQALILSSLVALLVVLFVLSWKTALIASLALLTTLYFGDLLFNFYLIFKSFSKKAELKISERRLNNLEDSKLPVYTILCPLYKEWEVLPQFVSAMSHLDYPKNKLQVLLLLEENDKETIQKAKHADLPSYFEIVVVPHSYPKTKPKACNYGLLKAKGEYVVIYDAEDVPDPLQLKKAYLAFQRLPKKTVCVQAKLNFYNPHQNLLTRMFTAEYSLWFDLVLTGLQTIHAPIPLGGTSNHFKLDKLKNLQGWDAFNVTEDCDLGIRLAKMGYQTAIVDSTTLEEANSDLVNWFWQRTRWIKGYIQTYLVHMRSPKVFLKSKKSHLVTFQLIVGGKVLSMFINPLMWAITISYFTLRPVVGEFIESLYPMPVLYMGIFSLIIGNFLYVYYYMIGCARREHYSIIKYVFLVPFYWLAMSVAGWVAVYKLIKAPHHWSKTVHGLHLNNNKALEQASVVIGRDLTDTSINPGRKAFAVNLAKE